MLGNNNRELFAVKIGKDETCLSYAVKRKFGVDYYTIHQPFTAENAKDKFSKVQGIKTLDRGDIVVWDKSKETSVPMEITKEGMTISHNVLIGFHCGIVEKVLPEGVLISDCTRNVYPSHHPCVRLRWLKEIGNPSYILVRT